MIEGAPDYRHLRVIQGKDVDGNLVVVRVDDSGRIILLPYGVMTVDGGVDVTQLDSIRVVQGADGATLHTLAVDASGRLIMLPYGWDGATYRPLKVDDEGRMIGVMKGQADVKWGLRGWWKFVGSEGTTIKDYSGYGNNGSAYLAGVAGVKYASGVIGEAVDFAGVNAYISCGHDTSLDFTDELTIEAWIYLRSYGTAYRTPIRKPNQFWMSVGASPGVLSVSLFQGGGYKTITSSVNISLDSWHHVVFTYNSDIGKLYIDNVDCSGASNIIAGGIDSSAQTVTISQASGDPLTSGWDGIIDEVRLYNRALSQDEINWRYEQTNPANAKPTRMIAVDSEGRMRVSVEGFPYSYPVAGSDYDSAAGAGTLTLYTEYVPDGKVWVITNNFAKCNAPTWNGLFWNRCTLAGEIVLRYATNITNIIDLSIPGNIYIKGGERLKIEFIGTGGAFEAWFYYNGYELDVL